MEAAAPQPNRPAEPIATAVRRAILWRSGSQMLAQTVQWAATFLVIRILDPRDYGLFAMTGVVLVFLNMLNGYGLASGLIREPDATPRQVRQLFGMLIALNLALALVQVAAAPAVAAYYRQPMIAPLLRAQALLYVPTPFIALSYALLGRAMDYRHQARANLCAAIASAATALGGALAGWGVWTLVAAPMMLFSVRAVLMTWGARALIRPTFDFRGAGTLARYGGIVAAGQFFWFLQAQADVFIGGRVLGAHEIGLYTTALFLAQIFVAKILPPLNEVAFSAYARVQHDGDVVARGFVRSVRIVMLLALPFYLGLAATAEPLVLTLLGAKWAGVVPIVRLLALAMPFMTLQVLYTPACDARGRPGIGVANGAGGATILATGFAIGVHWGVSGLAWSWLAAYPLYCAISSWRALPVIGARGRDVAAAVARSAMAALAMALVVQLADRLLPALPAPARLAALVSIGALVYAGWLWTFARPLVAEVVALARRRGEA